ncbi:hypothetical protein BSQ44_24195 [Aquibium oceanicum]|uniref:Uncharacterized protein n=1 Tax=Aquibium oceanicum TaxID=1670800 RepID=A0A1L3SXT0_9HYPH|nr:hypothetical protein BSQ44_24195 [Aquibium oceanicum]
MMKNDIDSADRPANQREEMKRAIEEILRDEIELAKPDDLAFLEFQVPHIAGRIARLRGWLDGR